MKILKSDNRSTCETAQSSQFCFPSSIYSKEESDILKQLKLNFRDMELVCDWCEYHTNIFDHYIIKSLILIYHYLICQQSACQNSSWSFVHSFLCVQSNNVLACFVRWINGCGSRRFSAINWSEKRGRWLNGEFVIGTSNMVIGCIKHGNILRR